MTKLSNTETKLKKSVAYKKKRVLEMNVSIPYGNSRGDTKNQ